MINFQNRGRGGVLDVQSPLVVQMSNAVGHSTLGVRINKHDLLFKINYSYFSCLRSIHGI